MINCDNETGNWYELYYQRFLICLLIRELEQQQRITGDEILGDRALYFFVLQYLISLHVFDDDLYPWQITDWLVWLFVWARLRSLLLRCFALWRNANLAGGFAGRFWLRFLFLVGVDMMICLRFRDHTCPFSECFSPLTQL